MLPSLFNDNQLTSNRLMRSIEEAKNDAAEFVLMQIYSNPNLIQQLSQQQVQQLSSKSEDQIQAVYSQNFSANNTSSINLPAMNPADSIGLVFNRQYQDLTILNTKPCVIDQTGCC